MSKTKKILIGIILLTIVLLGIGYAAIQNVTLNIEGTATADPTQSNFIVKFTGTPEVSDSSKVTAAITDDTNATIDVEGLTSSGQTVTATYTVENASSDLSADLSVEATNSNEEYFVIDAELAKTSIVAGETTTLTVTVELIKTPISTTENSTIGIELTATPVQPGEEGTTNEGTGNVSGTGLNEYGFYYEVPYSVTDGEEKYSYVFFEDGSAFIYLNEEKVYEMSSGSCVYADKSISVDGTLLQVSDDGTEIGDGTATAVAEFGVLEGQCFIWGHSNDDGLDHTAVGCLGGHYYCEDACNTGWLVPDDATYTLASAVDGNKTVYNAGEVLPKCYESQQGDVLVSGDYEYRYKQYFEINDNAWQSTGISGWGVRVVDTTKTEYGEIYSSINRKDVKILNCTFSNCTSLTVSPKIPTSVTYMEGTFNECSSLELAPEIPDTVIVLARAFRYCTSLTTAPLIPEGIWSLDMTFGGCTNLKTYVGSTDADGDFSNYVIPDSVTYLTWTFSSCEYLTNPPKIPTGVISMGGAFNACSSLTTAPIIPSKVTNLYMTFSECTNMKTYVGSTDADGDFSSYVLPEGLESMGLTFYQCPLLTAAPVIPNSVTILYGTFYKCTSLTGTISINTDKITKSEYDYGENNGYACFYGTEKSIVLKGTGTTENTATLQLLAGTANNSNVTVE